MEEGRVLDACYPEEQQGKVVEVPKFGCKPSGLFRMKGSVFKSFSLRHCLCSNMLLYFSTVFFYCFIVLFLSSCSLPRIIILTDPLSPEEHINLGLSYEQKGEFGPALREYEAAAKQLPIAYLYIGNLYFKKGDFRQAEKAYKKAIGKTRDPRAMNNLAWLYYTMDRELLKAEELAEEAVRQDPDNQDFIDTLNKIRERRKAQGAF